jgi:transposase-like protein
LYYLFNALTCNVVKRDATYWYAAKHIMPLLIDGTKYFSVDDIAQGLGVSRSTFWRWRRRAEGDLPTGRLYRGGKMVLFTEEEVRAIREFANRLEPVERASRDQMKLFNGNK